MLILAAAVAAIVWVASNDKPPEEQLRYGDVARAECARQAGTDQDSRQACITGNLLKKAMEMRAAER